MLSFATSCRSFLKNLCNLCVFFVEILLGWLNNSNEYDVLDFFSILE